MDQTISNEFDEFIKAWEKTHKIQSKNDIRKVRNAADCERKEE